MKIKLLSGVLLLLFVVMANHIMACGIVACCGAAKGAPVGKVGFDRDNQTTAQVSSCLWDFGDGTTSTDIADHQDHTYIKAGVYTVYCSVTFKDNSNCSSKLQGLFVYDQPTFQIVGPASGCYPFKLHVKMKAASNSAYHTWHYGDDSAGYYAGENVSSQLLLTYPPNDSLVTLSYSAPRGHFRLHIDEADTFRDNKIALPPYHVHYPALDDSNNQQWVDIFPRGPIHFQGSHLGGIAHTLKITSLSEFGEYNSFTWNGGNGKPSVTQPDSTFSFSYSQADFDAAILRGDVDPQGRAIFIVSLTAKTDKDCERTDTFSVAIDKTSGINPDQSPMSAFSVYPNPFTTNAVVSYYLNKRTDTRIDLSDITGKQIGVIADETQAIGLHEINVDARKFNLKPGMYLLKISLDGENMVRHLVKVD